MFEFVNERAREFSTKTKDYEATATLSLTASTASYTVSTAIASDVDEIQLIVIDEGFIEPRTIRGLEEEAFLMSAKLSELSPSVPEYFRVLNDTLKVTPTPAQAYTATVYYSVKIPVLDFTRANLAATVALNDEYLYALMMDVIGEMYLTMGNTTLHTRYLALAERKLEEARDYRREYGFGERIKYQDALG